MVVFSDWCGGRDSVDDADADGDGSRWQCNHDCDHDNDDDDVDAYNVDNVTMTVLTTVIGLCDDACDPG